MLRLRPSRHAVLIGAFALGACTLASSPGLHAQATPERKNWFGDPFFQLSHAIASCPLPAGPFITEEERRSQSHHRAEKGTTCWLAKQCERPNYYDYDAQIAEGVRKVLTGHRLVADATLWMTVQGRVVFIEGCVKDEAAGLQLESAVRGVPNVQQAVAAVYAPAPGRRPPYKLLNAP